MANGLGPFQLPRIQRTQIDPVALAAQLAAPGVAAQESQAQIFRSIAGLPAEFRKQKEALMERKMKATAFETERQKTLQDIEKSKQEAEFKRIQTEMLAKGGLVPIVDPVSNQIVGYQPKGFRFGQRPKTLTESERSTFMNFASSLRDLDILKNTARNFENLIGPLSPVARSEEITRLRNDPGFSSFKSRTLKQFNQYRKNITGAQASFPEIRFLEPATINIKDPPDVFYRKVLDEMENVEFNMNLLKNALEAQGKPIPKIPDFKKKQEEVSQKKPPEIRFKELEKSGLKEDQIYKVLKAEKY